MGRPREFREALDLTKRAAAKADDNGVILDSYGWALFKNDDLAGARRVLRQAADLTPDVPEIRYHLGIVYAAMGMREQALIEFEHATSLRPGYEDAENENAASRSHPPRQHFDSEGRKPPGPGESLLVVRTENGRGAACKRLR